MSNNSSIPPEGESSAPNSSLIWTDHKSFIQSGIQKMFETMDGADIEIRCKDKAFPLHKIIAGFFTDFFRDSDCVWMRVDTNPVFVEQLVRFMYLGEIVIAYDMLAGFLETCRIFKIKLFKTDQSATSEGGPVGPITRKTIYQLNELSKMCKRCYKMFGSSKTKFAHTNQCQRNPESFRCRYCDKTFRNPNDLRNHERFHRQEKPFACTWPDCGRSFTLKCMLVDHVRADHENKRYECQHCGKTFKGRSNYRMHVYDKHVEEKPFGCLLCGQCFALQTLLRQHMYLKHKKKVHSDRPKKLAVVSVTESGTETLIDIKDNLNVLDMPNFSDLD